MSEAPTRPRVLLADDEVLIRDLVQSGLEDAGYEVVGAATGREAVDALASDSDICGLVTDINFGSAPAGWEVATRARELNPHIAVVYMTGDSAHEWNARGVPQSTVITKPFAPSQIAVALAAHLNKTDGAA